MFKSGILACVLAAAATAAIPAGADTDLRPLSSEDIFHIEYATDPRISPDGSRIVYERRSHDIMSDRAVSALWIVSVDGDDHRPLLPTETRASSPRWSPQGDRIAYLSRSEKDRPSLNVLWLDTGQTAKLADFDRSPRSLVWAPDGRSLAFVKEVSEKTPPLAKPPAKPKGAKWAEPVKVIDQIRYRWDGRGFLDPSYTHVFVIPATGGTARQLTSGSFHHNGPLSFTPDSKSILFAANRNEDWRHETIERDIFEVGVDDGALTKLTGRPGWEAEPKVSPNGRQVAFITAENKGLAYRNYNLAVMDRDGSNIRVLTKTFDRSVDEVTWASSGRTLIFQYDSEGKRNIAEINLNGRIRTIVRNIGGTTIGRPYVSGSYTFSKSNTLAFTKGGPDRPADVATADRRGDTVMLTQLNEDLLVHRDLGKVEEIRYKSSFDGQEIHGWYVTPPGFDPSKKYPLVLEIHGGPHSAYGPHFSAEVQRYAAEGYVVFYDNHRGSKGYGEAFGLLLQYKYSSEEDAADHMSGIDALIEKGFVDQDNLFVTGGSAGGIASAYLIGLTDRFKAAAVAKPIINWLSKTLTGDIYIYQIKHQFPAMPWEDPDHYLKRSPLSLVGNVKTPTMLITGEQDFRTPISETEQFYQALKLRKIETVMVRVPGASHGIARRPSHLIAKIDNILAWFEKYRTDE